MVNTIYLAFQFAQSTTMHFYGVHFLAQSDFSCKIKAIFLMTSDHLDSYLILFLCLERFVAVFRPHALKAIFNRTKCAVYISVTVTSSLFLHALLVILDVSSVKPPNGKSVCKIHETPRMLIRQLILGYLPLIIMIPCNIVIVVKVIFQYKIMKHCIAVTQQEIQKKKSIKVSIFTLSITLSYISLILPNRLFFICCRQTYLDSRTFTVIILMPMLNSAINFYMFTLSSKEYRQKVKLTMGKVATYVYNFLISPCPNNSVEPAP